MGIITISVFIYLLGVVIYLCMYKIMDATNIYATYTIKQHVVDSFKWPYMWYKDVIKK